MDTVKIREIAEEAGVSEETAKVAAAIMVGKVDNLPFDEADTVASKILEVNSLGFLIKSAMDEKPVAETYIVVNARTNESDEFLIDSNRDLDSLTVKELRELDCFEGDISELKFQRITNWKTI